MSRTTIVFFLFLIGFLTVIYRLFLIQVVNPDKSLPLQRFVHVQKSPALRGEIYGQSNIPLVLDRKVYDVYANIDLLKDNKPLQDKLQQTLSIRESTMSALLRLDKWRRIKYAVAQAKKDALQKYYPTYLNFEESWTRYYPEASSSAYLLGFVGRDEAGEPKGYVGLEGYFDQELAGLPTLSENEADFFGISFIGGVLGDRQTQRGLDIHTTIDSRVQKIVEKELYEGVELYDAKQGCAIVMEPATGKITALSCVPAFDVRNYSKYTDSDFTNPLVSAVYEPGSTFKPLIVAMALEENKIKPSTKFDESGPVKIGDYEVKTWDSTYHGKIDVSQILEKSSNVGMVKIIQKLKKDVVSKYLEELGLYSVSGIELEGETNSLIKNQKEWYPIDYATLSFGQGIAITPLQLIRAFAVLANGGYLVKPTVVDHLYDKRNDSTIPKQTARPVRVFSEKTISQMRELLSASVNHSEAHWPNMPKGFSFCGKTGTAQVPIQGYYDPNKTIASFIGFLPCDNPRFLTLVIYREPKSSPWGSETAAPTFFDIAKSLILYYTITPSF
ncbi:MAG: penicillin-binding protein 2 [Patescibacteria group bacterium]|jgi:cell division protein FtsI/penicillin-binding protein 2